jgi:hypothetical protein
MGRYLWWGFAIVLAFVLASRADGSVASGHSGRVPSGI